MSFSNLMAAFAVFLAVTLGHPAQARYRHHHITKHHSYSHATHSARNGSGCVEDNNGHTACGSSINSTETIFYVRQPVENHRGSIGRYVSEIVSHPYGCPWRLFCACGVSVKIWGYAKHMAAAAFFRYPHASPASGMVAVRAHHVFYIERVYGDGTVLAYDPNSGGHLTRVHRVSLRGYRVVNPRG